MRKTLLTSLVLAFSCKNNGISQGEAVIKATEIFGVQAFCKGEINSHNGDSGWICFEVESEEGGHTTYRAQPIVICENGNCHRVGPKQTTAEAR